ncbi:MAG: hypothetical protein PHR35_14135 [Kiritimatiellae bacterium]|nr:hypothetical protein [Kiritimatiellia bacterium]
MRMCNLVTEPDVAARPAAPTAHRSPLLLFAVALTLLPRINLAGDWNLRVGPAWRAGNELHVDFDAAAVSLGLRRSFYSRTEPGSDTDAIGDPDAYADRDYLDGFVHTDPGTADPETDTPGLTWNWGYDSQAQNDGRSVSFHADGRRSRSERVEPLAAGPAEFEENFLLMGLQAGGERLLWRAADAALAAGVAINATWYRDEDYAFQVRRDVARRTLTTGSGTVVDRYETPGYTAPDAPYAGDAAGPGPLIRNMPDSRSEKMSSSSRSVSWQAASSVEIEMSQSELALGPWLSWRPLERLSLRLAPQLMLARVCLEADARTGYTPANPPSPLRDFSRQDETSEWLLGAGLETGVRVDIYRGWSVGCDVAATWWADDVAVRAEPFSARLDLGTWRASASVGREF